MDWEMIQDLKSYRNLRKNRKVSNKQKHKQQYCKHFTKKKNPIMKKNERKLIYTIMSQ